MAPLLSPSKDTTHIGGYHITGKNTSSHKPHLHNIRAVFLCSSLCIHDLDNKTTIYCFLCFMIYNKLVCKYSTYIYPTLPIVSSHPQVTTSVLYSFSFPPPTPLKRFYLFIESGRERDPTGKGREVEVGRQTSRHPAEHGAPCIKFPERLDLRTLRSRPEQKSRAGGLTTRAIQVSLDCYNLVSNIYIV